MALQSQKYKESDTCLTLFHNSVVYPAYPIVTNSKPGYYYILDPGEFPCETGKLGQVASATNQDVLGFETLRYMNSLLKI